MGVNSRAGSRTLKTSDFAPRSIPVSVIVLTKNESANIGHTLRQLSPFDDVIVVDSDSTDDTRQIASSQGARVVLFEWNGQYPKKKQWSLENTGATHDWVLLLDADEYPTADLVREIDALVRSGALATGPDAYDIQLSYRFAGRILRFGHRVSKRSLLNKHTVRFPEVGDLDAPGIREVEGHYQPQGCEEPGQAQAALIHDDRDPVSTWFERHNRYSDWEAHLRRNRAVRRQVAALRSDRGARFDSVPGKPVLFFLYSYFVKLGFLDGRAGLDYALALSMYYWQISVKVREKSQGGAETSARRS
ncbi:Glycosyl transferase family 2 [Blastococcus sp. DSM 46786]|uniref:glycosyltransferase family 2 protein n=1 Tax=Blastococcus sp. DSM 46786 TaxID=1798227 RepID=UPI0008D40F19|nr:glycosyltransferase family 2 protein [Blastococcus sp. DSM 46786]SEL64479.1 Glycosyl transferase family 2 [Blastococcus sp. DSM 46786]